VGEGGVEHFVRFDEAGGVDVGDGADGFVLIVVGEPGIELLEGPCQTANEDDVAQALAFGCEIVGRGVLVAERPKQLDGGLF